MFTMKNFKKLSKLIRSSLPYDDFFIGELSRDTVEFVIRLQLLKYNENENFFFFNKTSRVSGIFVNGM